jgi:alpha-beta hydrolase superfamily lysophospholipase
VTAPGDDRTAVTPTHELVVLVHGLAAGPSWMRPLARFLERQGYRTHCWRYASLTGSLQVHARRLREVLGDCMARATPVHLVAHSMGSIVTQLALAGRSWPDLGRVVLLAPPNHGSPVARLLAPFARRLCPVVAELSSHPASLVRRMKPPCGVQVGTIRARYDLLVPGSSTMLDGQQDSICFRATHTSLLLQRSVARQVHAFLATGRFNGPAAH